MQTPPLHNKRTHTHKRTNERTYHTTTRSCVLDGLDRLNPGTVSVLLRLVQDRELTAFDGTRFVSPQRWQQMRRGLGLSDAQLRERGVVRVHPSFRILALAAPPAVGSRWLANEVRPRV